MSDLELRVENLNVGFGRRTVLRDISFTVHSGEFILSARTKCRRKNHALQSRLKPHCFFRTRNALRKRESTPRSAIAYLPQLTQVQSRLTVFEMVMLGLGRRLSPGE